MRLADEVDAERAIAAAKAAFPAWSKTSKEERIAVLKRMHKAVAAREEELLEAIVTEYGAPQIRGRWMAQYPADVITQAIEALENFEFVEQAGAAQVIMTPVSVAGLIMPWNSDAGFICNKLATAMAAGCTAVIKPSEMSAIQTKVITEALHEAGIPAGVFNIVTGRGEVVGDVINHHPDIAKISFTGSTAVGKHIVASGAQSLKRVTLELGGKSPTVYVGHNQMRIAREEIFGPVLVVIPYDDEAPFGGFKQSGLGREMGKWGMLAYLEAKTLMVG